MKCILHSPDKKSSVYFKRGRIYKTDKSFSALTSYSDCEVIGKSGEELINLLLLHFQAKLGKIEKEKSYYIFNKEGDPKEVNVCIEKLKEEGEMVYHFIETSNFSLDDTIINNFPSDMDPKRSVALYSLDDLILLKVNDSYKDLLESLNICTEDLIGKPAGDKSFLLKCSTKSGYNHKRQVPFIKRDGTNIYLDIFVMTMRSGGKGKYVLNVVDDVTEVVEAINENEKHREKLSTILENVSDEIVILNKEGEASYLNKAALTSMKKLFNDDLREIYENNTITKYRNFISNFKISTILGEEMAYEDLPSQQLRRGQQFSDYAFLLTNKRDTLYNKAQGIPLYDKRGNTDGGILIYQDITDKIILEEYNVLKERTKDLFLNYVNLSYPDFKIMYINDEGYRTLKKMNPSINSLLSLIGENFFDFYSLSKDEEENLKDNIKEFIDEKALSYNCTHKFKINGKDMYLKNIFQPTYDKNKKVDRIKIVGIDITKEKIYNENLKTALKTKDELFVNISHELKTPLNVIFSAAQLLRQQLEKDNISNRNSDTYYSNEIILQNCYRLTKLINNILDISKIEGGFYDLNLGNYDIVSCTEELVFSIAKYVQDKGLGIIFDTDAEEMIISFDSDKFERIMLNLISNAIKFSKEKGTIFINLKRQDDFVEITVEDQGIGIDEKDLDDIFEKYHQVNKSLTRQTEGTGIGLSLVKSLVELHKGDVSVQSVVGEGTAFKIRLPNKTREIENDEKQRGFNKDITETIKFELSDIY